MSLTLHGIETCDSCRDARRWLAAQGLALRFHDLRRDGLSRPMIERWLSQVPAGELLNRRSQSWRRLPEARRPALDDETGIIEALLAEPLLVKRPVLEGAGLLLIGFSVPAYRRLLDAASGLPRPDAR